MQLFWIPNRFNSSAIKEESRSSNANTDNPNHKKISFKMFLTNKRAMMACLSSIFAMIFMMFFDTIYANYLLSAGISKYYIGYFFALSCAVYSVFSPIVGYLCKFIAKPYLTLFSLFMSFISLIMFGPSEILAFP
jgi:hypothetical protein